MKLHTCVLNMKKTEKIKEIERIVAHNKHTHNSPWVIPNETWNDNAVDVLLRKTIGISKIMKLYSKNEIGTQQQKIPNIYDSMDHINIILSQLEKHV
jgi:hypothetical protein